MFLKVTQTSFLFFHFHLTVLIFFFVTGLLLPDVLSHFNSDKTTAFISFLIRKWDTVSELLALPDLLSGLWGLRAHMILGPHNTKCFRRCLLGVTEVVSLLHESCHEMNRGDVSALVSSFAELRAAMSALCDTFLPDSASVPVITKDFLAFDFRRASVDPATLKLSSKMSSFLSKKPLTVDVELLFRRRFLSFISGLLMFFQEVNTQWYNGGLPFFDLFSVSSIRKFNIDQYKSRFEQFVDFLTSQNFVCEPLIFSWITEYPLVVESASSGCLNDFPSFRVMWDVLCSMGADITESHHFATDSFDFDVPV